MDNVLINKMKGFTLIELIIYLAILVIILVLLSEFLWNIVLGSVKETANLEVQQNGRFTMAKISSEIKKAAGINYPQPGISADSLSLIMADSQLNPTIFDVSAGKLRIARGTQGAYELTSDQVIVSNLRFANLSYPNTPGTIKIEMTIDYKNPENRSAYQASINLDSTVSLFSGGATP